MARVYWIAGFGIQYVFIRSTLNILLYHFYFKLGYTAFIASIVALYTASAMCLVVGLVTLFPDGLSETLPTLPFLKVAALLGTVTLVSAVSTMSFWGVHGHPFFTRVGGEQKLFALLPISKRGELVSVSADDHYVNVKTSRGAAHIRLKISAALELLADSDGMQVHRSHWVNLNAVTDLKSDSDGRPVVVLLDGSELPIAKSRMKAVRRRLAITG